jgi:hypothetical protein
MSEIERMRPEPEIEFFDQKTRADNIPSGLSTMSEAFATDRSRILL